MLTDPKDNVVFIRTELETIVKIKDQALAFYFFEKL